MTSYRAGELYAAIVDGSVSEVEKEVAKVLSTRDFEDLREAFDAIVHRLSASLAQQEVAESVELGLRLDRTLRRLKTEIASRPSGAIPHNDQIQREFDRRIGQFLAVARIGVATSAVSLPADQRQILASDQTARALIAILYDEGPKRWTDLKEAIERRLEGRRVYPTTTSRAINRARDAGLVRQMETQHGAAYELTYLGHRLAPMIGRTSDASSDPLGQLLAAIQSGSSPREIQRATLLLIRALSPEPLSPAVHELWSYDEASGLRVTLDPRHLLFTIDDNPQAVREFLAANRLPHYLFAYNAEETWEDNTSRALDESMRLLERTPHVAFLIDLCWKSEAKMLPFRGASEQTAIVFEDKIPIHTRAGAEFLSRLDKRLDALPAGRSVQAIVVTRKAQNFDRTKVRLSDLERDIAQLRNVRAKLIASNSESLEPTQENAIRTLSVRPTAPSISELTPETANQRLQLGPVERPPMHA